MNKRVITLISILFVTTSIFSSAINDNWINDSLSDSKGILNPANLSYRDEKSPVFDAFSSFNDEYSDSLINSILQNPSSKLGATFYGSNLALSFEINNYLTQRSVLSDVVNYIGHTRYSIGLDWGWAAGPVAFGLNMRGGSELIKNNFYLRNNIFTIPDYFVNTYFSRYEVLSSSQFFNIGVGFRFEIYDDFSLALVSTSDLSVNTTSTRNLNFGDYFKNISIGFSKITPKYAENGELNLLRFKYFADIFYLGDNNTREKRLSAEFRLQLSRDFYSSVYFGIQEQDDSILKLFFIDITKAYSNFGLTFSWDSYNLIINAEVPLKYFWRLNTVDDFIGITIKYSYEI